MYDFKFSVQGTVLKLANANILENIDSINQAGIAELISFCNAPDTGIVIYSMDGYEDKTAQELTEADFDVRNL